MARYKDEAKEQVRDAVDFADLVGAKIDLTRSGVNQLKGLCPFHDERTPSFGIQPIEKVYYCFGCGEGGDVFDFVMKTEGLDFVATLEYLADRYGVTLELEDEDPHAAEQRRVRERLYELLERTTQYFERYLWESSEAGPAREYLAARGLREEALRTFRVGYAPSAWDKILLASRRAGFTVEELHAAGIVVRSQKRPGKVYDRFRRRITFPLWDARGRVIGFGARAMASDERAKYINSPEGHLFHKSKVLYGQHLARAAAAKAGSVIVTEGYTDVVALHQAGLENVVCIMGTSLTEDQVGELVRLAPRSVLALDADNAGQEAMLRGARVAEGRKLELRVASLPPGRDPAELVQEEGPEAVRRLVSGSVPFVRFRIERILGRRETYDAEAKDLVIAEVRPILAALPPSALREELASTVARRLELSPALAALLVEPVPGGAAPGGSGPAPAAGGPAVERGLPGWGAATPSPTRESLGREPVARPIGLDRRARMERTFLTLCVALPRDGAALLAKLRPDEHLGSDLSRRAAAHLAAHLDAPTEGLPDDDPELAAFVRELAVRAGRASTPPAALQVEWLQLDLGRVERAITRARQAGESVGALARERQTLKLELDSAMVRAVDASAATS